MYSLCCTIHGTVTMSAVSLNGTSVRAFKAEEASLALSVATYKGELEHLARGPKNLHEQHGTTQATAPTTHQQH
jgi:hypothetical protein